MRDTRREVHPLNLTNGHKFISYIAARHSKSSSLLLYDVKKYQNSHPLDKGQPTGSSWIKSGSQSNSTSLHGLIDC